MDYPEGWRLTKVQVMAVNPILQSPTHGLHSALDRVAKAAADVVASHAPGDVSVTQSAPERPASGQDQIDALMDLKLYKREVQASAKVVQTADEVIGFLLDIKA